MVKRSQIDPALRGLVIVPAFNERQSVGKLAQRLHRALPAFDILVIDDGSTDDTVTANSAAGGCGESAI